MSTSPRPSAADGISFFLLTQLVAAVADEGGETRLDRLARRLARTGSQAEELARAATDSGVLALDGDRVRLLTPGRALAVSIRQRIEDAAIRSRETFQPLRGTPQKGGGLIDVST
jgi:hypothetical protein